MNTTRVSLLLRIRDSGDAPAWREFDAIYRPLLTRFALARGAGHADTEDIVQKCLVAVQYHIASFEYDPRKGRFKSWLCTMVNNHVRKLARDRRERTVESGAFQVAQQREDSPEETFERFWLEEHLQHCLRRLRAETDAANFTAFQRYALDNEPVEEVGRALNLTAQQLYKIKWRLTRKLKETMAELTGDDLEGGAETLS